MSSLCLLSKINEVEAAAQYRGVWIWKGDHYEGSWSNTPATAVLTVKSFTSDSVVLYRTDTAQSGTAGLTAVYMGHISPQGNSIEDGQLLGLCRVALDIRPLVHGRLTGC